MKLQPFAIDQKAENHGNHYVAFRKSDGDSDRNNTHGKSKSDPRGIVKNRHRKQNVAIRNSVANSFHKTTGGKKINGRGKRNKNIQEKIHHQGISNSCALADKKVSRAHHNRSEERQNYPLLHQQFFE